MPINFSGKVDDREITSALNNLKIATGRNLRPVMVKIGRAMQTSTRFRFRDQMSPDGVKWKPSKRATKEGGQTLRLTGRLQRSITYRAGKNDVEWGTNVDYGKVHQFGYYKSKQRVSSHKRLAKQVYGKKLRFGVWQSVGAFSRRMQIPARPFLGVSQGDRGIILTIAANHVRKGARR